MKNLLRFVIFTQHKNSKDRGLAYLHYTITLCNNEYVSPINYSNNIVYHVIINNLASQEINYKTINL